MRYKFYFKIGSNGLTLSEKLNSKSSRHRKIKSTHEIIEMGRKAAIDRVIMKKNNIKHNSFINSAHYDPKHDMK